MWMLTTEFANNEWTLVNVNREEIFSSSIKSICAFIEKSWYKKATKSKFPSFASELS